MMDFEVGQQKCKGYDYNICPLTPTEDTGYVYIVDDQTAVHYSFDLNDLSKMVHPNCCYSATLSC